MHREPVRTNRPFYADRLPTPLEPARNLGAEPGIDLRIKRDECMGVGLGGNKVRQLDDRVDGAGDLHRASGMPQLQRFAGGL